VALGLSMAAGFFMYGMTIIFVVPAINKLLPLKVTPHRTSWFSISVIPWYYHNALTYLVRYTFLEFITPTPLNKLFFKMMGMKVGKGTMINTTNISDPCLIELGDYVTIGGSATLIAHYGMKGMLIIDKLIIEDNVTIGLRASLFGDVIIGKGATVKPNEVILPKTRIPQYVKPDSAQAS
jgi:NDP-sugar pyrophosphorylase family protein